MNPVIKYPAFLIVFHFFLSSTLHAQVQARDEPRHRQALQNQYIRLLDVIIPPGDTTLFHKHSIPSLFVYYTNTLTATQVKGGPWNKDQTSEGKVLFRFYSPDSIVHRVANLDTVPFHVVDIEILSYYKNPNEAPNKPLPFPLLFENKRATIYRLNNTSFNNEKVSGRGPIIVGFVSGDGVKYHSKKQNTTLKPGDYLYIEPGTPFSFSSSLKGQINMVLLELK